MTSIPSRPVRWAQTIEALPVRWAHSVEALPVRLARPVRFRTSPVLDHGRLRWYRDETTTYRFMARLVVPALLSYFTELRVEGLHNVPPSGPVILAANHLDNLDPYLLLHLLPRAVHVAARPDGFGTGGLCGIWRRLGAFPADGWGMRHALSLLADGRVVAVFPQALISTELVQARAAVGFLALRSAAPVVPIAIQGTESVHIGRPFGQRAAVSIRFGEPLTFTRGTPGLRSQSVADAILQRIGALMLAGTHDETS